MVNGPAAVNQVQSEVQRRRESLDRLNERLSTLEEVRQVLDNWADDLDVEATFDGAGSISAEMVATFSEWPGDRPRGLGERLEWDRWALVSNGDEGWTLRVGHQAAF